MDRQWVECPVCGHKMYEYKGSTGLAVIEIKCHSCKSIVGVAMFGERVDVKPITVSPKYNK